MGRRRGLAGLVQRIGKGAERIAPHLGKIAAVATGGLPALLPILAQQARGRGANPEVRAETPAQPSLERTFDPNTGRRRRRGVGRGAIQGLMPSEPGENLPMTVDDQRYPSTQGGNVIDRIGDFAAMVNPYARTAKMAWDTAKAAWQVGEGIGEKVGTAIGEARDVYNRVIPASKKVSGYNGWIGSEPSVAETRTNRTRQTAEPRAQNVKRRRLNKTRRGLKRGET